MKVEIRLSESEALQIIIEYFQPKFPDKVITGDLNYSGVTLDVQEPPKGEEKTAAELNQ